VVVAEACATVVREGGDSVGRMGPSLGDADDAVVGKASAEEGDLAGCEEEEVLLV